ncbi:MAG: TetR/AcrR family transcriptional regulator [Oscillospiraceae bacterium]|nr:TetR/AcrR family transcriptional regulator [Oscillospiraceae bacterium]
MKKNPAITEATQRALKEAFWTLYLQKPAEQITVREICDLAGYNRSTFYQYFRDVYDVLEQIEAFILEKVGELGKLLAHAGQHQSLAQILSAVFGNRNQEAKLLRSFLMLEWNHTFERRLIEQLKALLISIFPWPEDLLDAEYLFLEYHINGILSLVKYHIPIDDVPLSEQLISCLAMISGVPVSAFSEQSFSRYFMSLAPNRLNSPEQASIMKV